MNAVRDQFLSLCDIDVLDVAVPHRLLRLGAEERNPQVISQAALQLLSRLQAAVNQIPATHLQWMAQEVTNASNFMLTQSTQPQSPRLSGSDHQPPPVPPRLAQYGVPWYQPPAAEPPVVIRAAAPRRRSGFDGENLIGIVAILMMLVVAGVGAKLFHDNWWHTVINPSPKQKPGLVNRHNLPEPNTEKGGGKPAPSPKRRGDSAAADGHLKTALSNLRKGSFDEADLDAQKALKADPDSDEAQGMRLAIGYLRQYSPLADKAVVALNANSVVKLGPKDGLGAFIKSNDNDGSITFQVKGRPKRFTRADLDQIPGFRFRVTRDFLDNTKIPANDVILGAYHFVGKLDGDGDIDAKGSVVAARERWEKAAAEGDAAMLEQADLLLKLLAWDRPD